MVPVFRDGNIKRAASPGYNYAFNTKTGAFMRWGETLDDDPRCGLLEIADIEVSEICDGVPAPGARVSAPCGFCYKSNTRVGRNMSFETFKAIFDKLPRTLTQIAFGIGNLDANPDLKRMFQYCRVNERNPGVIPNITINGVGLTDDWVSFFAGPCGVGGIAVSRYENKDVCYDAVKKLTDAGIKQVNVHQVLAEETYEACLELIDDVVNDPRLRQLKSVLFLTLKPKGKRNRWRVLRDLDKYRALVERALERGVGFGFDSCSAPTFLAAMRDHPRFAEFERMAESCESTRFSLYINVEGKAFPCSFAEGEPLWSGTDLMAHASFDAAWNSGELARFRESLLRQSNERIGREVYLCPLFNLYDPRVGNASRRVIMLKEIKACQS